MTKSDTDLAQFAADVVGNKFADAHIKGATTRSPLVGNVPSEGTWFRLSLLEDNQVVIVQVNNGAKVYFQGPNPCVISISIDPPRVIRERHRAVILPKLEHQLKQIRTARVVVPPK